MAVQKQTTVVESGKLSSRHQRALEVLLVGGTDQQAADAAGVARSTVGHWRTSMKSFIDALSTARAELLKRTYARLHAATSLAVKALEEVARDTRNPQARVAAARAILELSHKAIELQELQQRVDELEQWFEEYKLGGHR